MRICWGKIIRLASLLCSILLFLFSVSPAMAADVNALYKKRCLKCHGEGGQADGKILKKLKAKATDWTDKAEMEKLTDQYLFDIMWKGGKGVGKSKKMPAYKGKLSEEDVKGLVTFIRSFAK